MGRLTVYKADLAADICEQLAEGKSLRYICGAEDMPSEATVRRWALEDREGFSAQYTRAREVQALKMADEILEIADETTFDTVVGALGAEQPNSEWISRSRLRIETRKWLMSQTLPRVFGQTTTTKHVGADGGPVQIEAVQRRIVDPKLTDG
jgi:hypothetical protein